MLNLNLLVYSSDRARYFLGQHFTRKNTAQIFSFATSLMRILLFSDTKLFSLQLELTSAVVKCFTPSSVILLLARPNLFSLQLVCVSTLVKYFTSLSVIRLLSRPKLFSLQLVFII